jgi:hypothetical protein
MTKPRNQRLVALVRPDQKEWLNSRVTALRSLADVLRDVLDEAIARDTADGTK